MRVGIPAPALGSPPRALGRSPSPMSMPPVPKKEEKQGPKKKKKGQKKKKRPKKITPPFSFLGANQAWASEPVPWRSGEKLRLRSYTSSSKSLASPGSVHISDSNLSEVFAESRMTASSEAVATTRASHQARRSAPCKRRRRCEFAASSASWLSRRQRAAVKGSSGFHVGCFPWLGTQTRLHLRTSLWSTGSQHTVATFGGTSDRLAGGFTVRQHRHSSRKGSASRPKRPTTPGGRTTPSEGRLIFRTVRPDGVSECE